MPATCGLGRAALPPLQHLGDGGDWPEDGELDRAGELVAGGLEHRAEELRLRDRAVLQHLDRSEGRGGTVECSSQRGSVADVCGVATCGDPFCGQLRGELVDVLLTAGEQGDVEALLAEAAGGGDATSHGRFRH